MQNRVQRTVLLIVIIALVAIVDQVGKSVAMQLLAGKGLLSYWGDTVRFVLTENHGGFLSLGASLSDGMRTLVFSVLTGGFLLLYFVYAVVERKVTPVFLIASGMIIGGGIGNLIDRWFRDGGVIDFVNLGIGRLRTGIFNIADVAVLLGVILLFLTIAKTKE